MIVVTGATGQFGRQVVERLLERVPASEVAVSVRNPAKAADLAARGVTVRYGDFNAADSLRAAFAGADRLLIVSTDIPGPDRIRQHTAAVEAASAAKVGLIAYTSIVDAANSPLGLAQDHKATEQVIQASGVPFALLRNAFYSEFVTDQLGPVLEQGVLLTSAGAGRMATAARADLALAAAAVLSGEGHHNAIYELTGAQSWSYDELAAMISRLANRPMAHTSVSDAELVAILSGAGLPDFVAALFADIYRAAREGVLERVSPDLGRLIGRAPTTIEQSVAQALRAIGPDLTRTAA
jgi:NAD(P)H dehydrogenase (quinone)